MKNYTMVVSCNKVLKSMDAYMFLGVPTHLDDLNSTYKKVLARGETRITVCGNGDRLSDAALAALAQSYLRGEWVFIPFNSEEKKKGKK